MIRLLAQAAGAMVLFALFLYTGVLAWSAYSQPVQVGYDRPQPLRSPAAGEQVRATPRFEGSNLTAYPETAAQPVFFEGRRYPVVVKLAPPAPVAAPKPVVTVDGLKLLGTMARNGKPRALIEVATLPPSWVSVGDKVQTWSVAAIRKNSVSLTNDSQSATLSVYGMSTEQ